MPKGRTNYVTVHWCFTHARREWSDEACSEIVRGSLPDGTVVVRSPLNLRQAVCSGCGRSFTYGPVGRRASWCSDACRMQAKRSVA